MLHQCTMALSRWRETGAREARCRRSSDRDATVVKPNQRHADQHSTRPLTVFDGPRRDVARDRREARTPRAGRNSVRADTRQPCVRSRATEEREPRRAWRSMRYQRVSHVRPCRACRDRPWHRVRERVFPSHKFGRVLQRSRQVACERRRPFSSRLTGARTDCKLSLRLSLSRNDNLLYPLEPIIYHFRSRQPTPSPRFCC